MAITPVAGGGNWNTGATWNGGVAPTNADDVDLTGLTGTLSVNGTSGTPSLCKNLTTGTSTGTLKWNGSVLDCYGSMTLNSGININISAIGSATVRFKSTGSETITTNNKTLPGIEFTGVGGSWQWQDDSTLNSGTSGITHTNGNVDYNGKTISTPSFLKTNSNTLTITMGAATIQNVVTWNLSGANLTYSGSSGETIKPVSNSTHTFTSGGHAYGTFDATATHGIVGRNINDSCSFDFFTVTGSANDTNAVTFEGGETFTIGTATFTGNRAENPGRLLINSSDHCNRAILDVTSLTIDNVDIKNIDTSPNPWTAGFSATVGDLGGNLDLTPTLPGSYFWVSGAGTYSLLEAPNVHVKTTTGGSTASRQPLPQDLVIFDSNSFSAPGATVNVPGGTVGVGGFCPGMNFDGTAFGSLGVVGNTPTITFSHTFRLCGQMVFASAAYMTVSGSVGTISFYGNGEGNTFDVQLAGHAWGSGIDVDCKNTTYQQLSDFTTTNNTSNYGGAAAYNGLAGDWDSNGFDLTFSGASAGISLQTACARLLGTGTLTISGTTAANLQVSGGVLNFEDGTVSISGAGSTVTLTSGTMKAGTFTRTGRATTVAGCAVTIGDGGMTGSTLTVSSGSFTTDDDSGLINLSGAFSQTGGTITIGQGGMAYASHSLTAGTFITTGAATIAPTTLTVAANTTIYHGYSRGRVVNAP